MYRQKIENIEIWFIINFYLTDKKQMKYKYIYPILHGVLITVVYTIIKVLDSNSNILSLGLSLLTGAIIIYPFLKNKKEIFSNILWMKGVMFGLTQVLIYETLIGTAVLNTMISSLFGGLVVTILGFIFLKERIKKFAYLGVLLSFIGGTVYLLNHGNILNMSIFAIFAGILQGTTTTITRSNIKNKFTMNGIIFSNFFFGSFIIIFYSIFKDHQDMSSITINYYSFLLLLSVVLIAQYSLFLMMKLSTTQLTSCLTLSRIPAGLTIDFFLFNKDIVFVDLVSVLIIIIGATLTIVMNERLNTNPVITRQL